MKPLDKKRTTFWHIQFAGWGLYGLLYYIHMILFRDVKSLDIFRVLLIIFTGFLISSGLRMIYRRMSLRSHSILSLSMLSLICSFFAAIIWISGFRTIWGIMTEGWSNWNQWIEKAANISLLISVFFDTVLFTSWSALYFTIKFWRAWNEQKARAILAKEQVQKAQLQTLHYQMNPHFLFNAMNAIRALIGENKQQAKQMITELSEFLRYSLISKDSTIVPLHYEIEAIRQYFSIEKRRFEDKLDVQYHIDPLAESYPVVSFLLYPLAENAIKHGLKTSPLPLKIKVLAEIKDHTLVLTMANTGQWIPPNNGKENSHMAGLSMIRQQLKLIYPDTSTLKIEEKEGWVGITIEIQKMLKPIDAETI